MTDLTQGLAGRLGRPMATLLTLAVLVGCSAQTDPTASGGSGATGDQRAVATPLGGGGEPSQAERDGARVEPAPDADARGGLLSPSRAADGSSSPEDASADGNASSLPTVPPTATPTATPTPVAGRLVQLTRGGCCTQPFFSPDGTSVRFIDRPDPEVPTGIYQVPVDQPLAEPSLATDTVAYYLGDLEIRQELSPGATTLVRLDDGERWTVPAGGEPVTAAPDRSRIAWDSAPDVTWERQITTVFVANLDGSEAREVARLPRGGLQGFADSDTLLLRGRESLQGEQDILWAYDLRTDERRELARAERLRNTVVAPGGQRLAWFVSRDEEPEANGLFVADLDTDDPPRMLDVPFGAWRWRDAQRLLVVPLDPGAPGMRLLEHDVVTGETLERTPTEQAFKIAAGDWRVSPTGDHVAFVSAGDKNIWLIELPELR